MSQIAVESSLPAVPPGVLGNPPATEVGGAQAFALAIQLAMGVVTATTAGAPGATADADAKDQPGGKAGKTGKPGKAEDPKDPSTDLAADPALVVPTVASLLAMPVAVATPATGAPARGKDLSVADATAPAVPAPTTAGATSPGEAKTPVQTGAQVEVQAATQAAQATTNLGTDAVRPAQADRSDAAPDATASPAAPTAGTQATAATQPTAVTQPAAMTAHQAPAARTVAAQVIPEVTRLFSNGEGVHRVTLELNPKALGEVRVVLTVRHGDVHVRLAAGSDARQAMALSAGDLSRALEHVGVKEARLTLAELPGVTPGAATQTPSDSTDARQQNAPFTGGFDTQQHHEARHSRMGDDRPATDGTNPDHHGARTSGSRPIHEAGHVPSRGALDLRM